VKQISRKVGTLVAGAAILTLAGAGMASASSSQLNFHMVRSAGAVKAGCLPNAVASVNVKHTGITETMTVHASGLPANTDFDLFVIQVPNAPFGVSWYQGDLETDSTGHASGTYVGRFSVETFAVAPGVAPAPVVHNSPIQDASSNPAFQPVHTYHLGAWFNSPADAANAGCGNAVTPFNGEHNAGAQALSTKQFADQSGPLRSFKP
jgi:hypothetical protein